MTVPIPAAADRVHAIQTALVRAGYDPHGIDGSLGRQTWAAIFCYVARAQLGDVALALADGALDAFPRFNITIGPRAAHFVGQLAAETGFRIFVENLNYSAAGLLAIFPTHYTAALATEQARTPQVIANHVYGGRGGNGAEATGDGWRYRGRGPTMLTFRENYASVGQALGIDLEGYPDQAADPRIGMLIMGRYWSAKGLNGFADAGDVLGVSRGINLGDPHSDRLPNGLPDRLRFTGRAMALLR